MTNPDIDHWKTVKRTIVLCDTYPGYVTGLIFKNTVKTLEEEWDLGMYVDSDHSADPDRRRSRNEFFTY